MDSMEPPAKNEVREGSGPGAPQPAPELPQSKLRDLRPEKDPMGAGRPRAADATTERRPR